MCQSDNFSEAFVGVKPTVVSANSSSVYRDSSQGQSGVEGNHIKKRLTVFTLMLHSRKISLPSSSLEPNKAAGRHRSGTSFHVIEKQIFAFQHHSSLSQPLDVHNNLTSVCMLQPLITVSLITK